MAQNVHYAKNWYKTIREKLGISALDLSKRINVNISVISSWEAGIGIIPSSTLKELMKILNTSSEMILFGVERKALNIDSLLENQKLFIFHFYDLIKNSDTYKNTQNINFTKNSYFAHNTSEKIKYIREHILNVNQSEFGKMINVTRGSVSNWENGLSKPNLSHISMICTICHITTDYLLIDNHPLEISARDLSNDEYKIISDLIAFFHNNLTLDKCW